MATKDFKEGMVLLEKLNRIALDLEKVDYSVSVDIYDTVNQIAYVLGKMSSKIEYYEKD